VFHQLCRPPSNPKTLKSHNFTLFGLSTGLRNQRFYYVLERCVLATPIFNIRWRLARRWTASDAPGCGLCSTWERELDALERSTTNECNNSRHTLDCSRNPADRRSLDAHRRSLRSPY